jgi:tol-pal system protein YbgF
MKIATAIQTSLAIGFSCAVLSAAAQAPVSDVSTSRQRAAVSEGYSTGSAASDSGSESGTMFRQFQQLREEVTTLRGQLEEQSYELQKLKQQQQEDFANLDRRISGGGTPTSSATSENPAAANDANKAVQTPVSAGNTASNTVANNSTNNDGREEYEAAYSLLKAKDYGGASAAFKAFVSKYPQSDYAGNSWFWLGFVYQTQGDMDAAGKAFSSLIERFPTHSKVDDAKYNLGKIYNQQGKSEQARALLKEVAAGSSKSAPLAKSYLESM